MIEELYAVLERIKNTSSNNDKIDILSEFNTNNNIRSGLNFLYNTYIITGLALKKMNKKTKSEPNVRLYTLPEVMDYLLEHHTGSDQDIANIQAFINKNSSYSDFLKQFVTKSYKAGITAKSINKAFGEKFIPEFACQLAHPYAKFADRIKGTFVLTTKLDGHRTIAEVNELGDTKFFTRKGKPIEGLDQIATDIKDFANTSGILNQAEYNQGFVLDGEIIVTNTDDINKRDIFQKTGKIIRKNGDKEGLTLHVFDLIPRQEFFDGESTKTYLNRRYDMDRVFAKSDYTHLELLPALYEGEDIENIQPILEDQTSHDEEGIMINLNTVYKAKRHPGLLKVKEFLSDDLLVTGIFEGGEGTKYQETLGGVYVDYKGTQVGVGSGFSDIERYTFFNNPELIVGKIIEVKYFEETKSKNSDELSLRFPIYQGVRSDKTEKDVSYES